MFARGKARAVLEVSVFRMLNMAFDVKDRVSAPHTQQTLIVISFPAANMTPPLVTGVMKIESARIALDMSTLRLVLDPEPVKLNGGELEEPDDAQEVALEHNM